MKFLCYLSPGRCASEFLDSTSESCAATAAGAVAPEISATWHHPRRYNLLSGSRESHLGSAGNEPPENKEALKNQTEEAASRGLFGAPSFTIGDELFWGNDRLEAAFAWAKGA